MIASHTVGRVGSHITAASHRLRSRRSHASSGATRAGASLVTCAASCMAIRWRVRLQCTLTRSAQAPAVALRAARRIVTCVPPSALAAGSARPAATMCCAVRASTRTALQQRRLLTISWRGESGESCYRHRPPLTKTGARVGAPSAKPLRCSRASRLGHRRSGRRPPGRASRPPSPVAAPRSSLRRNTP